LLLGSGAFLFREPSWTFQNGNWLAAAHAIINHVRASVPASSSAMPHLHGQTPTATAKNKPQHKCHTTNHTARRRDFENWNIQFWWYMLLRYKRRSPQNRSNNRRPGNYGNDWVESFKTASKQMYVVFVSIHLDPCGTCGILATFGYGAKSLTLVCHHLGGVLCS
jgi:hypothetical protein